MKGPALKIHLEEIDSHIREGRLEKAYELLTQIKLKSLARESLLPVARLIRRSGRPLESLDLLYRLFNDESETKTTTVPELAEYALALAKVGGVEEAVERLEKADSQEPELIKTLGLCAMSMWDYARAERALREFVNVADGANYETQVARVNLAACLVFQEKRDEGERELELLFKGLKGQSNRLMANCHELKTQILIQRGDTAGARRELKNAEEQLPNAPTNDVLFLKKWQAYLAALEAGDVAPLTAFKKEALRLRHWESMRDADRLALTVKFDEKRFRFLYFGTPHAAYRSYLLNRFQRKSSEFKSFIRGKPGGRELSLKTGKLDGKMVLKPGQGLHRMFSALLGDFYRPLSIAALHWKAFPNQYFNPQSSPLKVHQTLHRLRAWIAEESLPVEIEESDGNLRVTVDPGVAVEIPADLSVETPEQHRWRELRQVLNDGQARTARELGDLLGWSLPKIQRTLKWSVDNGFARRDGQGRDSRYLLANA